MGAEVYVDEMELEQSEPVGDVTVCSSDLTGIRIDKDDIPGLIDELPIIAVAAARAYGTTVVTGAGELRVKESDRLAAITRNLRAMGIEVEEREDGFIIQGPQHFRGAEITTEHDHRIAMAFSVAGLLASGSTVINHSECVSVSMPHFYDMLETITKP